MAVQKDIARSRVGQEEFRWPSGIRAGRLDRVQEVQGRRCLVQRAQQVVVHGLGRAAAMLPMGVGRREAAL